MHHLFGFYEGKSRRCAGLIIIEIVEICSWRSCLGSFDEKKYSRRKTLSLSNFQANQINNALPTPYSLSATVLVGFFAFLDFFASIILSSTLRSMSVRISASCTRTPFTDTPPSALVSLT